MSDHGHPPGIWCKDCILPATTASAARPKPTFNDLLNDPTQQLDPESIVARTIFAPAPPRLTTAEREWLSDAILYGYDSVLQAVDQIIAAHDADLRERIAKRIEMTCAHEGRTGKTWCCAACHDAANLARTTEKDRA